MSCDAVRAALVEGHDLTPLAEHLAGCEACRALAGHTPAPVDLAPPRPDPRRWRTRARVRTVAGATGLLAAIALAGLLLARPPEVVPVTDRAPVAATLAPTPGPVDTGFGDPLESPDRLARIEVGGVLLDEPLDEGDPLDDFTDPTDLLANALLGKGNL